MVFMNIILKYAAYFKPSFHDPGHCSQQKCLYFIHICAYQRSSLTVVSKAAPASVFAWPSFIFLHSRYKYVSACLLSDSPLWTGSSRKTETLLLLIAQLLFIMILFAKRKHRTYLDKILSAARLWTWRPLCLPDMSSCADRCPAY